MSEAHQLICPMCEGTGVKNENKCSHCRGKGVVLFFQGKYLYWGRALGEKSFVHEKIFKKAATVLNAGLGVFSLSGIAVMIYWGVLNGFGHFFIGSYWLTPGLEKQYFGLSLLAALFLYYRLSYTRNKKFFVMKRRFRSFDRPAVDWSDINHSKKMSVDVSVAFDDEAKKAVEASWRLARHFNNEKVLPMHFLGALTHFDKTAILLRRLAIDFNKFNQAISHHFSRRDKMNQAETPLLSADFRLLLLKSYAEACEDNNAQVGVLDMAAAFAKTVAVSLYQELKELSLTKQMLANTTGWLRGQQNMREHLYWQEKYLNKNKLTVSELSPLLRGYCDDLTARVRREEHFPCVNRDAEIAKIIRSFEAGHRGVMLIGGEGAGKMSIVGEIARRALLGLDTPIFSGKRFASIDAEAFIGNENAEEDLLKLIAEIMAHGNIVLVLENVSALAGKAGGTDLADVLRHGLMRNKFHCLATSRPADYERLLAKHPLDELFDKIQTSAPDEDEAIQTLAMHSGPIEYRHGVYFSYDAIEKASREAKIADALRRLDIAAAGASASNKKFIRAEDI
ncbi:MAG: hypothetical protein V1763_00675 [Parcubacteria group bacterium]